MQGSVNTGISKYQVTVRLVMHDFCVLSYQVIAFNFGKQITATLEADELYVWKRHNLEASNNA